MSGRLNVWLLLLVGICGVSYWFGKDLLGTSFDVSREATPPEDIRDKFELSDEESAIHLVILNGTNEAGLAREVGLLLGRAGCVAENVGNAPHRGYGETFLVNRLLEDRKAAELASLLGGVRVLREVDGRGSEDAVLVLGQDWEKLTGALSAHRIGKGE